MHPGELNFVWERNLLDNRRCGTSFWRCELRNRVFDGAFGTWSG
ncbi:MAG TPA: hypothetical protein VHF46_06460 [Rubrobacteraceae bacterium]|nr:hypothetical protein [Rubrobacteraceae bacterium]